MLKCNVSLRRHFQSRVKDQLPSPGSIRLTKEELRTIDNLPFFKNATTGANKLASTTQTKKDYVNSKIPIVRKLFGEHPEHDGYLNYHLPLDLPNPYYDAYAKDKLVTSEDNTVGIQPRLSVTKLLTKSWCELREAYDIYSKIPIYEHAQMAKGKKEHQKLEDVAHPILEQINEFLYDFEVEVPDDPFHRFAQDWFDCMIKLLALFHKGEAREILCHGYMDSRDCQLLEGDIKDEKDILVSGVIDHLILADKNSSPSADNAKSPIISLEPTDTIDSLLDYINSHSAKLTQQYEIVVSDVKTRYTTKIPAQTSVIAATKLQVMYYRYFLEILGRNEEETFQKLIINAKRRGHDVDQPLDPAKLIAFMEASPLIIPDMQQLRDANYGSKPAMDMSYYNDVITDPRVFGKYGQFFTQWGSSVTLQYLAKRLAQIYHAVGPFLSDNLLVEYYCRGKNFHNIGFKYVRDNLRNESYHSGLFWFGKRDIEPIAPTMKNVLTYCKYCDYKEVCLWKKQIVDQAKIVGKDYLNVAE